MKKYVLFFVLCAVMAQNVAMGAVTIKKSASVATQKKTVEDNAGSLIGTVLGLVGSVKQLDQKTRELTTECQPTSQEIQFVNTMVKEWAKTGAATADEVYRRLGVNNCSGQPTGGYQASVRVAMDTDQDSVVCYDWFGGTGNDGTVWAGFPMATSAYYCTDGEMTCGVKDRKNVSNVYEIFNLVDFTTADYTTQEAQVAGKLLSKIENCSSARLSAQKKALWGEFLQTTVGGMGQKTNTGAIMDAVGTVTNGGGLQSLGGIASQFLNK